MALGFFSFLAVLFGCAGGPAPSVRPAPAPPGKRFVFRPIGVIHSPYTPKKGAPKQGRFKPDVPAEIEIFPEFEKGLTDLETFSHVWVLYAFDKAKGWSPLTGTPWDKKRRGVFATRSPRRPNPVGLTVVRLVKREGRVLHIQGIDAFDGTPVLDIKPYIPRLDVVRRASPGWLKKKGR